MPSQTASPPLTVTLLAALWVSLGRCDVFESPGPGCDNGKLNLDRDLPQDAASWVCPVSAWLEPVQRLPSIDTVYDPEPARQICMDKSLSYNHTIPNSGVYRPVRAENGEYLYCPPQRWLNNLHHGATVLLYHPCAPLHERLLLSVLARSCLPDYIITSNPQLNEHMPIALVSWGRTLELSTVVSSDVCAWLENSTSTRNTFSGVSPGKKYNLLLIRSAEQHRQQHPEEHVAKMKGSLRCCEQVISSLLNEAVENMKEEGQTEGKSRQIRAAIREKREDVKKQEEEENSRITANVQSHSSTLGPSEDSSPRDRVLLDPPGPGEASSQAEVQNTNQDLSPTLTTPPQLNMSQTNPSAGLDVLADGLNSENDHTASPEALALSSKHEGTDSRMKESDSKKKPSDRDSTADGTMKDNDVVDVKERELEHKQTQSDTRSLHKNTAFDSASKSQSGSQPQDQQHPNPQATGDSGSEARAAVVSQVMPRTPRTDEAVWAAAALGFLLVLLTLSVLHTRLYRHWRTTPSLYWHDPEQDYDSVADVIRRRLRIAKRRRKRGRRQECVLLPSSSSSDEHP